MVILELLARLFRRTTGPRTIRAVAPVPEPDLAAASDAAVPPPEDAADDAPDEAPDLVLVEPGWWLPSDPPPAAGPPLSEADVERTAAVGAVLRGILSGSEIELPVLPLVAQRALLMLQDENVDYGVLAALVGEDPAIAASVLRVVNSTAYARLFRVDRLEVAFTRLGRSALRSIIMGAALRGMAIRTGGPQRPLGEELWQRAIVSAVLLAELAPRYGLRAGESFLVGLLHDIGNLVLLRVLYEGRLRGQAVPRRLFDRLSEEWHEPLGAHLARTWRLGTPLPELIGGHHQATAADDPLACWRCLVQLADLVCGLLGYGPYAPCDFFAQPCVRNLGITNTDETCAWLMRWPALLIERTGVF